jgi:sugar phosphate permease
VYAILLWLPIFLKSLGYTDSQIANLGTANEVGTLLGGFILGFISDKCYRKRAPVAASSALLASLFLFLLTMKYNQLTTGLLAVCLFSTGLLLGGLHHLLCITCAADLGHHKSATSAVTGIIDGLGSLGTAVGQLVIGFTST